MTGYLIGWIVLLLSGMPIALTLGVVAFAFLWIAGGPMQSMPQRMFSALDSFPLLAVPAFVLAGEVMNSGGISRRIFDFARTLVGHIPGGLGHVNIVASVIVSGMSGSALADAAGAGAIVTRAMKDEGYDPAFSGSLTAASCIIGPLIPPSIPFVIYAVMTGSSVGRLFLAGILPGLLTAVGLMIYVFILSKRRNFPRFRRASIGELAVALRKAFLALLTPVIIMGGIFGGIVTPTEAAAVTALYALILGLFVYRTIRFRDLTAIFQSAACTNAVIGIIFACANMVSYLLSRERVPQALAEMMLGISSDPLVLLLIISGFLLLLGCFLESMSIMILTIPVLLPVMLQAGIDPVHFGVIVVMDLMIGLLTPPFGMALFVVSKTAEIPFTDLARGVIPMIFPLLLVLLGCILFPKVILFFPNLVFR